MPSNIFKDLAQSQLELLAGALKVETSGSQPSTTSKVKSIALYLPQENAQSGQLEFLPAVLYPPPSRDRVFIAADAASGIPPALPRTLTKLPGFSHAQTLLPGYPMVASSSEKAGVGVVEEVLCAVDGTRAAALSVPLFAGSQTTGVLLVYPSVGPLPNQRSVWTTADRAQVARAAQTLSLALTMDAERLARQQEQQIFAQALSDSLHQVKNPLQALRTYGKLLQQHIADIDGNNKVGNTRQLLELADHLIIQGDRLSARLQPVDAMLDEYSSAARPALMPYIAPASNWTTPLLLPSRQDEDTPPKRNFASITQAMGQASSVLRDFDNEMTFVADVLAPILQPFAAIAADQGVELIVEESPDLPGVLANAEALQEAVSNVIDNAIKYVRVPPSPDSPAPSSPQIKVSLRPNDDSEAVGVTILIEDNGPGIPDQARELVFQRGYRGTQSVGGSGIGLDIARTLVEKMGGTLEVLPSSKGARLQFRLFRRPPRL